MPRYVRGLCKCGNYQTSAGRYKGRQVFKRYCHRLKTFLEKDYISK